MHDELRACGATTVVTGQDTVKVNGQFWAVEGDKNSHEEGPLKAENGHTVKIQGKKVKRFETQVPVAMSRAIAHFRSGPLPVPETYWHMILAL